MADHEASFYEKLPDNNVRCILCPHYCQIPDGKTGFCGVRENKAGALSSSIYGEVTSIALDPIEKKPLYHFHPGEYILSVGTKGCNLKCGFCQNCSISQDLDAPTYGITSQDIIEKAKQQRSFGIAYTYNEPLIWYEFVFDTAVLAKKAGLKNVLVTNGYVNPEPLKKLLPFIDAMNVDIKSIDDSFYRKVCRGTLKPVLETVQTAAKACHIELTNLIIPTLNDSDEHFEKLTDWIDANIGAEVPLHFSRYFPCYQFDIPPTPPATLKRAQKIAERKLRYVHLGNM